LLDRLISEIANLLQIPEDQVRQNYSEDKLNQLLEEVVCEDPGIVSNFIDSLEVPCQDPGTNFDPNEEQENIADPVIEERFDPTECKEAADQVSEEIKDQLDEYNNINILLNKLVEFYDHIKIIGYYYKERVKRSAYVLKDFRPLLLEKRRIESNISSLNLQIDQAKANLQETPISNQTAIQALQAAIDAFKIEIEDLQSDLSEVEDGLDSKSSTYDILDVTGIGYITNLSAQSTSAQILSFNEAANNYISTSEIYQLSQSLRSYSEHIKIERSDSNSFDDIIKGPRIRFEISLQGLDSIQLDRENFNQETGERSTYTETFPIAENPLLENNSFKDPVPGYRVRSILPQDESTGVLYSRYYNRLSDPVTNFFTLEERGLTETISQLDPVLKGSDNITKREAGKDYYIKDLEKMNSFYKEFDTIFENKKKEVRNEIDQIGLDQIGDKMRKLARRDVDLLLATAGFNTNLIEDSDDLRTVVDKIKLANESYVEKAGSIESEIARLRARAEELKPTPEKVKQRLKDLNSKCFGDSDVNEEEQECPDVKSKLGTDPFYLEGTDGSLPNFTQICYWKEFSNIVNTMGLAPIPNSPTEFRYWPVGIIIPTPAKLIKIPLPIIWIPIIVVSSPLGTIVTFLTINGIFISPIIFFISASGHKQHIATVRGPSPKFGSDQFEEVMKSGIKVPVSLLAAKDKAIRIAQNLQLPQVDLDRIASLEQKRAELEEAGDADGVRRVDRKLEQLNKKAENLGKSNNEVLQDILESKETAKDAIEEIRSNIKKKIDAIGRPITKAVEDLKTKAIERREELRSELVAALEAGDDARAKEIRKLLKSDGIDLNEKVNAIAEDIQEYFNGLDLPSLVIPKEEAKVNPLPTIADRFSADSLVKKSNFSTRLFSKKDKSVKTIFKMDLAKYRKEIDQDLVDFFPIDLDMEDSLSKVSDAMEKALTSVIEFSMKLDNRPALGFNPLIISQLSSLKIDFNPFDPCCSKPQLDIDLTPGAEILALLSSVKPIIKNYVEGLDPSQLKSLFGGKRSIQPKDIRFALNGIISSQVPDSLEISIPEFGLSEAISAASGVISSIQIPQAPFPPQVKVFSAPKQISINLNTLIKPALNNLLEGYISSRAQGLPRNIETDFVNLSGADLKAILTRFLDYKLDQVESLLDPIYAGLSIFKSAKDVDLNVLEKTVHSLPIYGKAIETAFSIKTIIKMNLPPSLGYSIIDPEAFDQATRLIIPLLSPIVNSPIAYLIVAGAGATGNIDNLKKLHPILNHDDIPSWERLTASNLLLLIFLDEFIYEAANKVGFFRQYL
jgi:hypothetical protein